MTNQRFQLWIALIGLAIGAIILHYQGHPPSGNLTNAYATVFSGIDLVLVSLLFLFRGTALYALLLNSFLAFLGIIIMTDLAIQSVFQGWIKVSFTQNPIQWIGESMLPYITIVIADFMVGLVLYSLTVSRTGKFKEWFS